MLTKKDLITELTSILHGNSSGLIRSNALFQAIKHELANEQDRVMLKRFLYSVVNDADRAQLVLFINKLESTK